MTNPADQPSEVESTSIADLAADAAIVRRLLDIRGATVSLPRQHSAVSPDSVIPDGALALVAGLDAYGD